MWNTGLWKAHYRLAQALYQKHDDPEGNKHIEQIWKHTEKAYIQCGVLNPGKVDQKLKEFHADIKKKHSEFKESQNKSTSKKSKKNQIKSVYKGAEEEDDDSNQIKETKPPEEPVIKEEPIPQAPPP